MTEYPEKTCEIDRLVTREKLVAAALQGRKTQQRRDGIYGYPGETFQLDGVSFMIQDLRRQHLGEMTEEDAQCEGHPSIEVYRNLILSMHPGMSWEAEHSVWVHEFARVD